MTNPHLLQRGLQIPSAVFFVAAACSFSVGAANAQATAAGDDQADGQVILEPISITATRNPLRSFEYPGMITVIGKDEIQAYQPSAPDDILRFVPGVEFTGGPRRIGQTPSIRGFGDADVIITIDGARQQFGSTHDGRFFIDPSLLEGVEVLRGSASSLYGSGGNGGIIEFRTLDADSLLEPGETTGVIVSGGHRSVNSEQVGNLTAFSMPNGQVDLVASITKRDSGAIELSDGNVLRNTDDDIVAGLFKAGLSFDDHHRLEGAVIGFRNNAMEPNNGQEGIGTGQTAVGLVDKDIRANTLLAGYSYQNPDDDLLDLNLVLYRTEFQADELRLEDVRNGPRGELLKRDLITHGARLDNRSRVSLSDDISATITYGAEFWRDEQDGEDGGMRDGRPDRNGNDRDGVPDADARFKGLFTQAEIAVEEPFGTDSGHLLVIPGVRHDDYTISSSERLGGDNDHDRLSPRVGISWLPKDELMVFASYAEAFRAPTVNEVYLTGTHFPLFNRAGDLVGFNRFESNPDLKPQATRTVEFGAGLDFDGLAGAHDRLRMKATYFRTRGEDFIDRGVRQDFPLRRDCIPFTSDMARIPSGPPGTFLTGCEGATFSRNIPKAKLWGFEMEGSYENSRLRAVLGFSSIDGKNEMTGGKLGVLTPDQYTLDLGIKLAGIDSILGWRMLAADRFDNVDDPEDARAGYHVHDFYYSWQPGRGALEGLRVDLGINNAFDKHYTRVDTAAAEPGRGYSVSVVYSLAW